MIDAEKVLRWMGFEDVTERMGFDTSKSSKRVWRHPETFEYIHIPEIPFFRIDATWIMEKLVPALEKRLRIDVISYHLPSSVAPFAGEPYKRPEPGHEHSVLINGRAFGQGTGPTFEAAFLAAAAAAIRGME